MNIIGNFKNSIERFKAMKRQQLSYWKYTLFFLVVADIVGVYWFLNLKNIGIALIVVFLICLGFIMFLESRLPKEEEKEIPPKIYDKNEKEVKKKMPEEKNTLESEKSKEESGFFGFDMGLPSSEEYNKRLNDAFEFKGF